MPHSGENPTAETRSKRGILSGISHQMAEMASVSDIKQGARLIRTYRKALGRRGDAGIAIEADRDGRIDVLGSALLCGLSEEDFLRLLTTRRRNSARLAYFFLWAGSILFVGWCYSIAHMMRLSDRTMALIEFIPCISAFYLLAFAEAWRNWQIRTMRMGSPKDYLFANDPFFPR